MTLRDLDPIPFEIWKFVKLKNSFVMQCLEREKHLEMEMWMSFLEMWKIVKLTGCKVYLYLVFFNLVCNILEMAWGGALKLFEKVGKSVKSLTM